MTYRKCINCALWKQRESPNDNVGECRAHPPTVCLKSIPVDKEGKVISSNMQLATAAGMAQLPQQYWPMTTSDGWCGDFVQRNKLND